MTASSGSHGLISNNAVWAGGDHLARYLDTDLTGAEARVLYDHRAPLAGRVLELGCGPGRLTSHLIRVAETVEAMDISPRMLDACRARYPEAEYRLGDLRDLTAYPTDTYAAVVATCCVLDVLDDQERAGRLAAIHGLLRPGGLLVLTAHNRHCLTYARSPTAALSGGPVELARALAHLPRRWRNHRRLAPLQRDEPEYALINDDAHEYALLHYYVDSGAQARQLERHGYELVAIYDLDGSSLAPGDRAAGSIELLYVARRPA